MTDITSKATVYPSANDVAEVEREGRWATEVSHANLIQKWAGNYIVSGLALPPSGGTLNIAITAGAAIIDGRRVVISDTSIHALPASNTSHIWCQLSFDGDGNTDGVEIVSNTTGAAVTNAVKLGTATTDGSSITSTNPRGRMEAPYLATGANVKSIAPLLIGWDDDFDSGGLQSATYTVLNFGVDAEDFAGCGFDFVVVEAFISVDVDVQGFLAGTWASRLKLDGVTLVSTAVTSQGNSDRVTATVVFKMSAYEDHNISVVLEEVSGNAQARCDSNRIIVKVIGAEN